MGKDFGKAIQRYGIAPKDEEGGNETLHPDGKQEDENLKGGAVEATASDEELQKRIHVLELEREPKSKRLQLLLRPTVFKELKQRAKSERLSVNEYLNRLLIKELMG